MNNRRHFITLVPFAGAALLAACSKESSTTDTVPAPAPMPAPEPAAPMTPPATTDTTPPAAVSGADLPLVDPAEPVAVSLGYVAVASQADKAKFPNHAADQMCSNCSLYTAGENAPQGPCALFPGKAVLAGAWCSAWVKRA